jgi:hypothetical protein
MGEPQLTLVRVEKALTKRVRHNGDRPGRPWLRRYLGFRDGLQAQVRTQNWMRGFMRPAFLVIGLFEVACIGVSLIALRKMGQHRMLPFEIFNALAGFMVLSIMWTLWFDRHWRATAFGFCSIVLVAATALSFASGRTEPLFMSVLLLLVGAGSLVPWDTRWQTALTALCLGWLVINAMWLPSGARDPDGLFRWLALLAAAGLAHVGASRNEHHRREIATPSVVIADDRTIESASA